MWADRNRQKKPRRGRWVFAALALVVLVVIGVVVGVLLRPQPGPVPPPVPPTPAPPTVQPASCPDVEVIAVPGTWESSPTDDPYHPSFNPNALMLNVTKPLQDKFDKDRVLVYTVPYIAQFAHPMAPPQAPYDVSRTQGMQRTVGVIADRAKTCPLTHYVLTGFSQGAVIAGDVASQIGNGQGPVSPDKVLGVGLIADGRRVPAQAAVNLGTTQGVGAEVALGGLHDVPGIPQTTMRGPRPGGFGALKDKSVEICNPADLICAAPANVNVTNLLGVLSQLAGGINNPVHAQYNSFVVQPDGTTATQYLTQWAEKLVENAPKPAHP